MLFLLDNYSDQRLEVRENTSSCRPNNKTEINAFNRMAKKPMKNHSHTTQLSYCANFYTNFYAQIFWANCSRSYCLHMYFISMVRFQQQQRPHERRAIYLWLQSFSFFAAVLILNMPFYLILYLWWRPQFHLGEL